MRIVGTLIVALVLSNTGCKAKFDTDVSRVSEGISYDNAEEQNHLKQALSDAGIPYQVTKRSNREFITWDVSYIKVIESLHYSAFLPTGRSISLDVQVQSRFKIWLAQSKIPYKTILIGNSEYIIWEEEDSMRVKQWEEFVHTKTGR